MQQRPDVCSLERRTRFAVTDGPHVQDVIIRKAGRANVKRLKNGYREIRMADQDPVRQPLRRILEQHALKIDDEGRASRQIVHFGDEGTDHLGAREWSGNPASEEGVTGKVEDVLITEAQPRAGCRRRGVDGDDIARRR